MGQVARPFSHQPLSEFARDRYRIQNTFQMARLLGVTDRTVIRWKKNNVSFTIDEAEKYAEELGVHPSAVWANYSEEVLT